MNHPKNTYTYTYIDMRNFSRSTPLEPSYSLEGCYLTKSPGPTHAKKTYNHMRINTKTSAQQFVLSMYICAEEKNVLSLLMPEPKTWLLNPATRLLINDETTIKLTPIECLVLDALANGTERVASIEDILKKLNKCPEKYTGLFMCLSRLQAKFKRLTRGENLFRAVRNCGYCLTQRIHIDRGNLH